ncbi:MAG TPA: undecaprenyldiphospho-muramoylpentapeptide beta-N-acetylglucosaminyltransferase [Ferruginibacter sp.]|nr:undecaprenyldiphospho-muramoylpentapeptide beta-N-acetylglucosaminyltransferase [Ferruginibacter sp.]HPH91517.1 undecaprenyldiphospho-muramoylpentapeptide beta-N-acetylglucosaminyltransferase [Ferruginibacter sp.]
MNESNYPNAVSASPLANGDGGGGGLSFIMAGGGTGGHIFPAVAIANAIKKLQPDANILFIGAKGKMEMEKVPQAGYMIEGLDIAGYNRSSLIKNLGLPYKLIKSFLQVKSIFKKFKPDAVIGVGGYSSFPVLRYAQSKGIQSFIHESNSFAGKTNILLGKKANKIFVAIDGMEKFFPADRISISGNPVRAAITNSTVSREDGIGFFGLDPAKKTVLSVGGSLGAKGINEALEKHIDEFESNGLQLIWQTGRPYALQAQQCVAGRQNIWANDFITQMEYAYAAADVIISRSGAMSVSEICVIKKPAVFVPFPFAAEDHQTVNAKKLVDRNAAMMVKDSEASDKLVSTIIALAKDEQKQNELKQNIGRLAVADADMVIAKGILKSLGM